MDSWQQSVPEGMTTKSDHLAVSNQPLFSYSYNSISNNVMESAVDEDLYCDCKWRHSGLTVSMLTIWHKAIFLATRLKICKKLQKSNRNDTPE